MNKPAATVFYNGSHDFFIWPLKESKKDAELYEKNGVHDYCRDLSSVHHKDYSSSELTELHIKRAKDLADNIVYTIKEHIKQKTVADVYVSSEGLSYGSKGDATLNLATYKAVLLVKLLENFDVKRLMTFSPISIKAVAGCAGKDKVKDKNAMINSFKEESLDHPFKNNIEEFKKKTNYTQCVDDIVDSYFCLKKMLMELEQI